MKKCVVVIPIYKVNPTKSECASFKQVLTVLGQHNIVLLTYTELDLSVYEELSEVVGKKYNIEYFDLGYFRSLADYNRLCYSLEFYNRFLNYEYMLIYQLDAWVFRDELMYWCDKGYDYIGAPMFLEPYKIRTCVVGNGGFSLRRISYCIKLLNRNRFIPYLKPFFIFKKYYISYLLRKMSVREMVMFIPLCLFKSLGIRNTPNYYINSCRVNEDAFFSVYAKNAWGVKANIPTAREAAFFSFEVYPTVLYNYIGEKIPFGCHAFEKCDYLFFWSKYIAF